MKLAPVRETVHTEPILEVRGLTKHFPVTRRGPFARRRMLHAVDGVDFALYPGKIVALVGESGSGKSTIARLLAQLYPPTSGSILFHGHDVHDAAALQAEALRDGHRDGRPPRNAQRLYRSQVQMVFQDPFASLNPVKPVAHHLERPLQIHRIVPAGQVRPRVRELLTTVGLVPADEFARKFPHQLSGGQRQRVSIARALAVEPRVLIADEPISMLDVSIRMGILNLMLDLKQQTGLAFLYITHDIASARYVADDVLVMYAGQVVERGETDTVLQRPLHPYTKLLLSAVPNPESNLARQRIEGRGEVQAAIDPPDACRFLSRCPVATELSPCKMPKLLEAEPGHWVRCHLYPHSHDGTETQL